MQCTLIKLWSTLATCFEIKCWKYWDASGLRNWEKKIIRTREFFSLFSIDFVGFSTRNSSRRFYASLIKANDAEESSREIKSATERPSYGNVTYRITAKWLFVLVFARWGWATSFRVQRQKGILKYERELLEKGPVYIHTYTYTHVSILRRCTIAARTSDYMSFFFFILNDYRHEAWLWHFNRRVEICCVKSCVELIVVTERGDREICIVSVRLHLQFVKLFKWTLDT